MPESYSHQDSDEELECKLLLLGAAVLRNGTTWACVQPHSKYYFFKVRDSYKAYHAHPDKRAMLTAALDAFMEGRERFVV